MGSTKMDLPNKKALFSQLGLDGVDTSPVRIENWDRLSRGPVVSVSMPTFNHAPYITQAIESVLMQETTFAIELIVGEDCSSDETREIVLAVQSKHEDKIRVLLSKENLGKYTGGNGRLNGIRNLKACRGKYIALLEGDDYWSDPLKLQKQVDFLEAHSDFVMCGHKIMLLEPNGDLREDSVRNPSYDKIKGEDPEIEDFIDLGTLMHTSSLMFRNCIETFPDEFFLSPSGDALLAMLLIQKGRIKRLDEAMSVYRRSKGMWPSQDYAAMYAMAVRWESCILSYLPQHELRLRVLRKMLKTLAEYETFLEDKHMDVKYLVSQVTFRTWLAVAAGKIRKKCVELLSVRTKK